MDICSSCLYLLSVGATGLYHHAEFMWGQKFKHRTAWVLTLHQQSYIPSHIFFELKILLFHLLIYLVFLCRQTSMRRSVVSNQLAGVCCLGSHVGTRDQTQVVWGKLFYLFNIFLPLLFLRFRYCVLNPGPHAY